jgi:hypothetical protein
MRITKMLAIVAAVAMGMASLAPAFLTNAEAARFSEALSAN